VSLLRFARKTPKNRRLGDFLPHKLRKQPDNRGFFAASSAKNPQVQQVTMTLLTVTTSCAGNLNRKFRGLPKTSVLGKATLDLTEKAGFGPLSPWPFPKLTGFWERLFSVYFESYRPKRVPGMFRIWPIVEPVPKLIDCALKCTVLEQPQLFAAYKPERFSFPIPPETGGPSLPKKLD
jgi:hypothetical protein